MRTANLYATENGYAWDANYAMGGDDLISAAQQANKSTDRPFIPIGRRTLHERALAAVKSYSESNTRQGYTTREQAEYGKKVKPFVVKECKGKSLFDRVLDFFTYEVVE